MLQQNKTVLPTVSIEAINSAVAKLGAADPEMIARANELKQLAGQDGNIVCERAGIEEPDAGKQNSKWRWSWPF